MLFSKTLKSTATDLYVQNMLAGFLGELSGMQMMLTQCKLKYSPVYHGPWDPEENPILHKGRSYANRMIRVEFEVFFTSPQSPRRYGREGQPPCLPFAKGEVVMTSETHGFTHWDVFRIHATIENGIGQAESGLWQRYFTHKYVAQEDGIVPILPDGEVLASEELMELSKFLMHQRPKKMGYEHE